MTTLERGDKYPSPIKFDEDIFGQSTQRTHSPLKMHAVYIEDRPVPETVDISVTPSPLSTPDNTLIAQSSLNESESLEKAPAVDVTEQQVLEDQIQQTPPAIPPKSPLRGAKKTNWLSRLLNKTVGRLSCFHGDDHKKAVKQCKHREFRAGSASYRSSGVGDGVSSPPVITIPDLEGIADFGDIFAEYLANSADGGGGSSGCGGD